MSTTTEHVVTTAEINEALKHLNHRSKREVHVVGETTRRDGVRVLTPWDKRHASINRLLDARDAGL